MIKIRSPVSEEEVSAFEAEKGIRLPGDYRRFITTIAGSGSQPFYGLLSFRKRENMAEHLFPYTLDHSLYFLYMTEEEMDQFYDDDTPFTADHGLLALCTEGDGMALWPQGSYREGEMAELAAAVAARM